MIFKTRTWYSNLPNHVYCLGHSQISSPLARVRYKQLSKIKCQQTLLSEVYKNAYYKEQFQRKRQLRTVVTLPISFFGRS